MSKDIEQSEIWIKLLRRFNSRLRLVGIVGLGLFAVVFSDWHIKIDDLNQKSRYIFETLSELSTIEKYRSEAKQLAKDKEYQIGGNVDLADLPALNREMNELLRKRFPQKKYHIGAHELTAVPYRLTLIGAPIILLVVSIITTLQLRRLHLLLGSNINAIPEAQLLLNSPLCDRVTLYYGEKRWLHFLMAITIYSPIVFAAAIYFPAVIVPELEPVKLYVTSIGYLPSAPPEIDTMPNSDKFAALWATTLGLTIILWLTQSYIVTKPWYKQSSMDEEKA